MLCFYPAQPRGTTLCMATSLPNGRLLKPRKTAGVQHHCYSLWTRWRKAWNYSPLMAENADLEFYNTAGKWQGQMQTRFYSSTKLCAHTAVVSSGDKMTRVLSPTCQDCLPSLKPKGMHTQARYVPQFFLSRRAGSHGYSPHRVLMAPHLQTQAEGAALASPGSGSCDVWSHFCQAVGNGNKGSLQELGEISGPLERVRTAEVPGSLMHTVMLRPLHPLYMNVSAFKSFVWSAAPPPCPFPPRQSVHFSTLQEKPKL